jgi:signal transduction histidine kinase
MNVPDGCGFVDGDPHKLERLILNVMHNAIKFTPARGRIEVRMGSRPDWPGFLALDVIDNGPGIDPQHLHRVTERYYRVGEHVTGTGIGLTICKEILDLHGGRLDLKSPRSYLSVVAIVAVFVAIFVHRRSMMVIAGLYLLSGPAAWFMGWAMRGRGGPRGGSGGGPGGGSGGGTAGGGFGGNRGGHRGGSGRGGQHGR